MKKIIHKFSVIGALIGVAALLVMAVGATAASAQTLPEVKLCVPVAAGEPSSWKANCPEPMEVGGGYAKVVPPSMFVPSKRGVVPKVGVAGTWCAHVENPATEKSSWEDNKCSTAKSEGGYIKFTFTPTATSPTPDSYTSTSGKGVLETEKGRKVECESDTDEGAFTTPRADKDTVHFDKCTATGPFGSKLSCHSTKPAGATGEIVTNELASTLVYINSAETEVGVLLEPLAGPTAEYTEFECGGLVTIKVRGSVIGKITPVNTMTTKFTLTFAKTNGVQNILHYWEGKTEHTPAHLETEGKGFETFAYEQSSEEDIAEIFPEFPGEIKA